MGLLSSWCACILASTHPCTFSLVTFILNMGYVTTTVSHMLVHLVCKKKTVSCIGWMAQMYSSLTLEITESWLFAMVVYDRCVAVCHPWYIKSSWAFCCVGEWWPSVDSGVSSANNSSLLWSQWDQSLLWSTCSLQISLCGHISQWPGELQPGLHPSVGPTFPHHHCLHQKVCCFPHHHGYYVLYSIFGYVNKTWLWGLFIKGQKAGSVLQCHFHLPQLHHLQS